MANYWCCRLLWLCAQVSDSIRVQQHQLCLVSHENYDQLQTIRKATICLGVVMLMSMLGYPYVYFGNSSSSPSYSYDDWQVILRSSVELVIAFVGSTVAIVLWVSWVLSLYLASRLADNEVSSLVNRVSKFRPEHLESWAIQIERPALKLNNMTLPALSAWAPGIATTFLCFWAFAVLSIPFAKVELRKSMQRARS